MEILTTREMYRADALAMEAGRPGVELMQNAGEAICRCITGRWPQRAVTVLCGPGNNGGDGFVVARLLTEAGWPVKLALLGSRDAIKGDAAHHAALWTGAVRPLAPEILEAGDLVVDALFGAGLGRDIDGVVRTVLERVTELSLDVVAVDVPSGISGDTGEIRGYACRAAETVTFFRPKPGHYLCPGREHCGRLTVADIGIPEAVLDEIAPQTSLNAPDFWQALWPVPKPQDHKYRRGHLLVAGGSRMTGAARLALRAARRTGAGLATVLAPKGSELVYQCDAPGVMVCPWDERSRMITDPRCNVLLAGPGLGTGKGTRLIVEEFLATGRRMVLDADGLSCFEGDAGALFGAIRNETILTPHDGEFARLFPHMKGDRLTRARTAAGESGAVIVLKGADSIIADPGGRAVVNANAPAWLATGGTGDVLAGMAAGLLARGMPAFEAACAAVWLHGEAASRYGPGLIAEDLPEQLPALMRCFDLTRERGPNA
jgi:NAD(P)H-hydrate epimerase